jgi:uncharacterized protein (DUF849 family)
VRLQAALNGARTAEEHAGIPVSAAELARDGAACAALGAFSLHLHPRDGDGAERLDAALVDGVVRAVREAAGVPVGVSTREPIEPDAQRRVALVSEWTAPDFASVNLAEDGAVEVMRALLERGIGIEAGLSTGEDAERLAASGLADRVTRCLVEPYGDDPAAARTEVGRIHAVLDAGAVAAPRLQHSDGPACWAVLADAVARGHETRVGLEDVLTGPAGESVAGNADLVRLGLAVAA